MTAESVVDMSGSPTAGLMFNKYNLINMIRQYSCQLTRMNVKDDGDVSDFYLEKLRYLTQFISFVSVFSPLFCRRIQQLVSAKIEHTSTNIYHLQC